MSKKFPEVIQELLTVDERSIFGRCPICDALPGEKCTLNKDAQVGSSVHFERLVKAPKYRVITYHY